MLWNTARVASEKSLNAARSLPIFGQLMNNHPFSVAKALAGFDVAPPAAPSQPHDLIVRVTKGDGIVDWNVTLEGTTFHQDPVNALQAQLIVDRAGARDVLFGADNGFRSSENKVRVNIDSKEESLALACFGGQWSVAGGNLLPGIRLKAKATDGLKELIRFT